MRSERFSDLESCSHAHAAGVAERETAHESSHASPALMAQLVGADFPVPQAQPIAMPTQQFEYWTPSKVFAALVGLIRRWRPAPLFEPDATSSRQSGA